MHAFTRAPKTYTITAERCNSLCGSVFPDHWNAQQEILKKKTRKLSGASTDGMDALTSVGICLLPLDTVHKQTSLAHSGQQSLYVHSGGIHHTPWIPPFLLQIHSSVDLELQRCSKGIP